MRSSGNDRLVARDTDLPGLRLLLDLNAFARAWDIAHQTSRPSTATIQYVRYKPGRRCVVMYLIRSNSFECQVVAVAHNRDSWRKHRRTRDDTTCDTSPDDSDEYSQGWISVALFPRDRKLRLLEQLRTPRSTRNFVRSFVKKEIDQEHFHVDCVAYKPGRRAVYDVRATDRHRYALKFFEASAFGQAKENAIAWDQCKRKLGSQGVDLPKIIRADAKRRILVTRWLPGNNLASQMGIRELPSDVFYRVGGALGELHGCDPQGLPEISQVARQHGLFRIASDVGMLVPQLSDSANFYATEIQSALADPPNDLAPLHGDFYAKQLCITDRSVGILDFDQSAYGDPLHDVGNFIAKIVWNSYRGDFHSGCVDEIAKAFLDGYARKRESYDPADIELQIAAGLFKCLTHPFRSGMSNWEQHIANVLDLVSVRFDRHRKLKCTAASRRENDNRLAASQSLAQRIPDQSHQRSIANALTAEQARERILRFCPDLIQFGSHLEVDHAQLIRHKPGRRCLIRYDLRIAQSQTRDRTFSIIGKLRFKGVDQHGYAIQRQLHEHGFSETNLDGISVPKTLGIDPENRIWYQEHVPGQTLEQITTSASDTMFPSAMQRIAGALDTLHRVNLQRPLETYTADDEVQSLIERLRSVASEQPKHAAALNQIISKASRLSACLVQEPSVAIHRDFHPSQILLTSDRLYLLDFDLYCHGPETLDAGNFLAHLWELMIRFPDQSKLWQKRAQDFTDSYHAMFRPGRLSQHDLDTLSWLAFARHIWISTRIPERSWTTAELIDAVQHRTIERRMLGERTMLGEPSNFALAPSK